MERKSFMNICQHLVLHQTPMAAMFNSNPIASPEVGYIGPKQGPHLTSSSGLGPRPGWGPGGLVGQEMERLA